MDIPLEIAFHNVEKSEAIERRIRERVARMERYFAHVNSCRVVFEAPHRSAGGARQFHLRVETRVPDKELVVSRDPGASGAHFDPLVAVRDAFDAMDRQLEAHGQKARNETKLHPAALQGRILRLFDSHGFAATNDGREIYFHRDAVPEEGFDGLSEGDALELTLVHGESPAGPQASTARPIRPMDYMPRRGRRT
ncbi:HPF/RaiA family ribosome-associated protein [Amaricoccus solimangrovi]|nr:HPF/RaiA family ribosome-associated protein [Amaricoccus solimangrovi]